MSQSEETPLWQPDEWVCSHYQRSQFGDDLDVWDHLSTCYVDMPGYWEMDDRPGGSG